MNLDEILDYLDDLEFNQHTDWLHEIIHRHQTRLSKRRRAAAQREKETYDPGKPSELRGSLGAEREG